MVITDTYSLALCNSNCKIPDGMDTAAGAIVSDDSGRCEISLGVQGGSEAYALRDRATSGDKQVQLCWDNLADRKSPSTTFDTPT
jgi:hypothetical protein